MPSLSILLPHKHTAHNDAALKVALSCIVDNTLCDYELIVDTTTPGEPYRLYNRMARQAASEWLCFFNSDTFPAPGWDTPMLEAANQFKIITPILVECGAISVNTRNVHQNFGMTPPTFQRQAFEQWAANTNLQPFSEGWYMPALWNKRTFLDMGGFDTTLGEFPAPLDGHLHDKAAGLGLKALQVRSFCYHLQAYADFERTKEARLRETVV